ncbi:uncharacterized protein PV09_07258 [Verruconis gallopava]|uniref:Sulphur transport domain-containing protein n=1 Tax=Verruconis gallopava TaxID=253628 RepID=A0A0D1XG87_9PEZI|nr:uncharacterized protein PV09_07258 [Verruconis gallopava]KIW01211.1 hypothetical protein PV09_07258 [Verruconis gallopava]
MFTPFETTAGALLLHLATTTLLFDAGAILGASGLLRRLLRNPKDEISQSPTGWFFGGMIAAVGVVALMLPQALPRGSFEINALNVFKALVSGSLIGWGTKHCGGCTSGHMLCGIGRLSPRSFLATAIFVPVAIATFHFTNPSLETAQCRPDIPCFTMTYPDVRTIGTITAIISVVAVALKSGWTAPSQKLCVNIVYGMVGIAFGLGLLISGMADSSKVQSFFAFELHPLSIQHWDPSLSLIFVGAVLPNLIKIQSRGFERPPRLAARFSLPTKMFKDVDVRFVLGAIAFGISWGWTGVCPGPAVIKTLLQPVWGCLWMIGFYVGSLDMFDTS